MGKKLMELEFIEGQPDLMFDCPGCGIGHGVWTKSKHHYNGAKWSFNGDMEKPTFSPSLLVRFPQDGKEMVCHSFVRDGKIQFLNDCTHDLAGKTVDLPDADRLDDFK